MSWRDRIVADGADRDVWLDARHDIIGASDAKSLSKLASVPSYLTAKLTSTGFHGNETTASGHRWEPIMLAWLGIPENTALIRHPTEPCWGATPDGIVDLGLGRVGMAECKAKHNRIVAGPSLPEWRQVAWQFLCVPEAEWVDWTWVELTRGNDGEFDLRAGQRTPQKIRIHRDDPKVIEITQRLLPIARELSTALTAARRFEKEHNL